MTHVRIWKFRPPKECEEAFAQSYSGNGRWAELFSRSDGYRGTKLLRPADCGGWWVTLDRWKSAADFEAFGQQFGGEYRSLDEELEGVAGDEEFIGAFEEDD